MSNCILCNNPAWIYKNRYASLYCESCRIADVAEGYVGNLAAEVLNK